MAGTYARFWALVDRSAGPAGCWPWNGPLTARGVPVFNVHGGRTTARRFAYSCQYGDPGPLRVSVTCGGQLCCNWRHLAGRTSGEVALSNGSAAALNANRSQCAAGHDLTIDGALYVHPGDGRRECALCKTARHHTR